MQKSSKKSKTKFIERVDLNKSNNADVFIHNLFKKKNASTNDNEWGKLKFYPKEPSQMPRKINRTSHKSISNESTIQEI